MQCFEISVYRRSTLGLVEHLVVKPYRWKRSATRKYNQDIIGRAHQHSRNSWSWEANDRSGSGTFSGKATTKDQAIQKIHRAWKGV